MKCGVLAPKGFRWRDKKGDEKEGRAAFVNRFKDYVNDGLDENVFLEKLEVLQYQIDLKIKHLNETERLSL